MPGEFLVYSTVRYGVPVAYEVQGKGDGGLPIASN